MIAKIKKIVLIDPSCRMIHSLIKSNKIIVDTLIVGNDMDIENIRLKYRIENILSFESINHFYLKQDFSFDYNIIKDFRETELKVEHFLSRVTEDINSIQNIYYSSLFYWYNRFKINQISGVMSSNIEFGSTFDSVIFDVAKYYSKPVYITEVALSNGYVRTNQLFDYTSKQYLPINLVKYGLKGICKEDFIFNSSAKGPKKSQMNVTNSEYSYFERLIIQVLSKIGGYLLLTFPLYILGKHESMHHTFKISWWTFYKNYLYTKKIKSYYNELCVEFDSSNKYIYFPLHMEPEAGTQNRTISANQLIIIRTISRYLPENWILYVKEHPHQYENLNKMDRYYYLSTINKFKTKRYYDEINKIPNVRLLSTDVHSEVILNSAQATVSINGTIILESILKKIPVLAFSQNTTPFIKIDGVFEIKNSIMCSKYLKTIINGYKFNDEQLDNFIKKYFYQIEDSETNKFNLLIEDLMFAKIIENK